MLQKATHQWAGTWLIAGAMGRKTRYAGTPWAETNIANHDEDAEAYSAKEKSSLLNMSSGHYRKYSFEIELALHGQRRVCRECLASRLP